MKIFKTINSLINIGLTICVLYFVGLFFKAGLAGGNLLASLIFIGFTLVGGFFVIGLIWGWWKERPTPSTYQQDEFTGEDTLSCISGKAIADEVTRGLK